MSIDMAAIRKENVKQGSMELLSLNKVMKSAGQNPVQMNANQLVAFHLWFQGRVGNL